MILAICILMIVFVWLSPIAELDDKLHITAMIVFAPIVYMIVERLL